MKLEIIKGGGKGEIINCAGGITLTTSVDTLGASFNFDLARNYNDSNFLQVEKIRVGDIVEFSNIGKIFSGVIVDIETMKFKRSVKCLDFFFYLNKNKLIKQFNSVDATSAIVLILTEIGAKIGSIESVSTKITKIYRNNTVAEIVSDILELVYDELGVKYILEIEGFAFNLVKYKEIKIDSLHNIIGDTSVNESITEMKNKIIVTSNNQEETNILYQIEDAANVTKYGMLQDVVQADPEKDDISKVRQIAETRFKESNKVFTTANVQVLGKDDFKAGRLLKVSNGEFSLNDSYLIRTCTHKWEKNNHTTSMELEVI